MGMTPADKIKRARIRLLLTQPFFGNLACRMEVMENPAVTSTMGTEGRNLFYNAKFVDTLTQEELIGVICHEVLHCANLHHLRVGRRHPVVWNLACDYAINPTIEENNFKLPKDCLLDQKYKGWAAERIYDDLLNSGKVKIITVTVSGGQGDGQSGESEQGDSSVAGGTAVNKDGTPIVPSCGEVLPVSGTEEQKKQDGEDWTVAVRQAALSAKMQGKLPANLAGWIDKLVEPVVDWKGLLWEFVETVTNQDDYTYNRPNSRYIGYDLFLPTMHGEACPSLAVTIDTSGSVSEQELTAFLSELNNLVETMRPERTFILDCDATVHKCRVFERGESLFKDGKWKTYGRGGTDFRPPFDYIQKHRLDIACHIYLTDMQGPFPTTPPPYPCLWIATTDTKAPFGQTVKLDLR